MGCKDFKSHSSIIEMPCLQSTNEDTKQRFLNCESNINESMLWTFLSSYFPRNERKESRIPQICFLMLEANKKNSRVIAKSSSINWFKFCTIPSSFNLEIIVMALFRASLRNQWSLDWFRTQIITIVDKQSTIVS